MRTTLSLDSDVAALLKRAQKVRKASLKTVVNDAMRQGLKDLLEPPARPDGAPWVEESRRPDKSATPPLGSRPRRSIANVRRYVGSTQGAQSRAAWATVILRRLDRLGVNRATRVQLDVGTERSHVRKRGGSHRLRSSEGFVFRHGQHFGHIV